VFFVFAKYCTRCVGRSAGENVWTAARIGTSAEFMPYRKLRVRFVKHVAVVGKIRSA
jgi:hypothetical protein